MTVSELEDGLRSAQLFSMCGQFRSEPGAIRLQLAIDWDWLPTSRDQPDPIHGLKQLEQLEAAGLGPKRRAVELSLAKAVLAGQRSVERYPVLIEGPDDYAQAALAGAQFAARMAGRELLLEQPGFWVKAVTLYIAGFWPCGTLPNQDLVVY
ncbi:hypothetical protein EAG14_11590 [Acidovorax sp. 1608163]|uniref:hypothetical protein n=1 Tax=Acidovorax sp. 1608163 TaxID=2478662 RepID=UPI000EF63FCB|nr:hypothetical protein [Acidovorax sp. 1608163]AYM96598.1 hypothetical protein EAG14_11590 [Acidovorax sp. 1608163]